MKRLQLNRRQFMQATLGIGAACMVGQSSLPTQNLAQHPLLTHLSTLLPHQASARLIGQHYLQRFPQEAQLDHLVTQLTRVITHSDAPSIHQQVTQQIGADFRAERIVKLQGWVLSVTEARLCALASLLPM